MLKENGKNNNVISLIENIIDEIDIKSKSRGILMNIENFVKILEDHSESLFNQIDVLSNNIITKEDCVN